MLRETLYESVEALQADLDQWLLHYNTERPHQGYRNMGKRPIDTVDCLSGCHPGSFVVQRVSKADGSQMLDLQRDALQAAGVDARSLYDDRASGTRDDRPGLTHCLKALREGER